MSMFESLGLGAIFSSSDGLAGKVGSVVGLGPGGWVSDVTGIGQGQTSEEQRLRQQVAPPSPEELALRDQTYGQLSPSQSDAYLRGNAATAQFAEQLRALSPNQFTGQLDAGNVIPNQQQMQYSQQFAQQMFAPQQAALKQSFDVQRGEAESQAARLGRSVADPVLQAKLRIAQTQQQAGLQAQQGQLAAQTAMALPQQEYDRRMGVFNTQLQSFGANQAAQLQGYELQGQGVGLLQQLGLQSQQLEQTEFARRMQMLQQEQNYRLQSAGRITSGISSTKEGALGGLLGILGTAAQAGL